MTSKEALENLVHCKSETKCKECKHKYRCTMERDYNTIKQDLKRKEVLEKENEELKYKLYKIQLMEAENKRMFDVNQKLLKELGTEKWKGIQFSEDFKKYKIAINILKDNLCIEFNDNYNGVKFKKDKYDECDYTVLCLNLKSQYDLLKEIFKNE